MPFYTKKPVRIEARQFQGKMSEGDLAYWCKGRIKGDRSGFVIEIDTLEGEMIASPGDYIIKGIKGEFYPCKPDIFAATYDEVEDQ